MTISNPNRVATAIGNGVATIFPYTFPILDEADVEIRLYTRADNNFITLAPSDYSITGVGPASTGGAVTYAPGGLPITNAYLLAIYRTVPYTQDTDIRNQDGFYPEIIETQLDRIVMQIQQLAEMVGRSFILPPTFTGTGEDFISKVIALSNITDEIVIVANNIGAIEEVAPYAQAITENLTAIQSFANIWYGPKSADPTTRNDGSAMEQGDVYFSIPDQELKIRRASDWKLLSEVAIPVDGSVTADSLTNDPTELEAIVTKLDIQSTGGWPVPSQFGAVGDGVTNDTTALQAFFDNTQKRGELEAGKTYLVSSVTVPADTVFTGPRSAVIKKSNTSGATVVIGGNNVNLSGFTVNGSHTDTSVASGFISGHYGIKSQYTLGSPVFDIKLDNLEVLNCGESGIDLRLVTNVEVSRCKVHRCGYGGIMTWSGLDVLVRDCQMYDIFPGDASGGATAPFQNAYGGTFSNYSADRIPQRCTFLRNLVYDVPTWEGLDEHHGREISFLDNIIIGCSQGISSQHSTVGQEAYRIIIRGNIIKGFGTSRVYNGQTCYSTSGIIVNGGAGLNTGAVVEICDNELEECGDTRPSPGGSGAIKIENVWRFTIQGNVVNVPYRIGIILNDNGTTSNRVGVVSGNVVSDVQAVGGVARPFYFTGRSQALVRSNVAYGASSGSSAFEQASSPAFPSDITDNKYWAS